MAIVFLDLAKAFDSVDRTTMLRILFECGVMGKEYQWFESYFNNRKQFSEYDGIRSTASNFEYGVIQGSSLGPVLFSCYTSSFSNLKLGGNPVMFADDIAIVYAEKDIVSLESTINEDMGKIYSWMSLHKLTVNVQKTKFIIIKSKNALINIKYNNAEIEQVKNYKYLGVCIDEELTWNTHITELASKTSRIAGIFKKLSKRLPDKTKISTYYSLFHSIITYGIEAWGSTFKKNLNLLQKIQNKALKNLFLYDKRASTSRVHRNLNILKLNDYKNLCCTMHVRNILHNDIKSSLQIATNSNFHHYSTRTAHHLRPTQGIGLYGIEQNINIGIKLYNDLPPEVKASTAQKFKITLKKLLLEQYNN